MENGYRADCDGGGDGPMKSKILCNLEATMLVLSPSSDRELMLAMVTIRDLLAQSEPSASRTAFWDAAVR